MESMVEENGSTVDPLSVQGSQSDSAPAIATSVQSIDRTHQQQTHHLIASTSIVQLTLPSSGTTQVYRRLSCVSMSENLFSLSGACVYRLFILLLSLFSVMQVRFKHLVLHNAGCVLGTQKPSQNHSFLECRTLGILSVDNVTLSKIYIGQKFWVYISMNNKFPSFSHKQHVHYSFNNYIIVIITIIITDIDWYSKYHLFCMYKE